MLNYGSRIHSAEAFSQGDEDDISVPRGDGSSSRSTRGLGREASSRSPACTGDSICEPRGDGTGWDSEAGASGDPVLQFFQKLTSAPGPSGFEEPVTKIMVDELKPYVDRITYDGLGSMIAVQGMSGPRVMLDAHMDELGGIVRRVTSDGFLTMDRRDSHTRIDRRAE